MRGLLVASAHVQASTACASVSECISVRCEMGLDESLVECLILGAGFATFAGPQGSVHESRSSFPSACVSGGAVVVQSGSGLSGYVVAQDELSQVEHSVFLDSDSIVRPAVASIAATLVKNTICQDFCLAFLCIIVN